jgi:hypothetical protein
MPKAHIGIAQNRGFTVGFEKYLSLAASRGAGYVYCYDLKRYPAILSYYAAGVTGVLSGHLDLFARMSDLIAAHALRAGGNPPSELLRANLPFEELFRSIQGQAVLDWLDVNQLPAESGRIFKFIKPLLLQYTSDERAASSVFDRLEYLISLLHADFRLTYRGFK